MLPFWMIGNHFGKRLPDKSSLFLSAVSLAAEHDTSRTVDFSYGVQVNSRFDGRKFFFLEEAYLDFFYRKIFISCGRQERFDRYTDHPLSTGSIMKSRNAPPLPEILIGTDGFMKVPFTKGYVEIKGLLSHGWFGKDSYVANQYLHHKNLYIRLGGTLPVNVSAGLEHYAIWGGVSPEPEYGELPKGWGTYGKVFFASRGSTDDPSTPKNEALNKLGNHLGSRNYRIDLKTKKHILSIYYQTIFEDFSGFRKLFMPDGLWGIVVESVNDKGILTNFLFEHFESTCQSGGIIHSKDKTSYVDDYFNHYIYKSGWTYHGYTIGNPLITSPVIAQSDTIAIINNRVSANHFGVNGFMSQKIKYIFILTFIKNLGTYPFPYNTPQRSASALITVSGYPGFLKGMEASVGLGFDIGDAYGNNAGISLTIIKRGSL
jgi:hypothetical protein